MPRLKFQVDRYLLINIALLVFFGLIIFLSASLSLLSKEGAAFGSIAFNQIFIGIFLGSIFAWFFSNVPYKIWGAYSYLIFGFAALLTFSVFIPGLGFEHGGARRWIEIGSISFQPAEILKYAYILVLATWFSRHKKEVGTFKYGFLPFVIFSGIAGGALLVQPDTDTAMVMLVAGGILYFVAGAKWRYVGLAVLIALIGAAGLIFTKPYILDRAQTFLNPAQDPQNSGYQIQQSLIAIGSGGVLGRGFGQSIQKFSYLPEPIGDSIFAVASEEFGFVGAVILIILFSSLLIRGLRLSTKTIDSFGGLLMLGIVILITSQSFLNMASMLGLFPLSGLPLIFISHGGTAIFVTLCAVGIMLNISKYQKT